MKNPTFADSNYLSPSERIYRLEEIEKAASDIVEMSRYERDSILQDIEEVGLEFAEAPVTSRQTTFSWATEKALYTCAKNLVDLQKTYPYKLGDDAEDRLVRVWTFQDFLIIRTPYLSKQANTKLQSCICLQPLLEDIAHHIPNNIFQDGLLVHYILSVYPEGTSCYRAIDADNINAKAVGDIIMRAIDRDDNGIDVSLCVYALRSDDLMAASYTVITNRDKHILSPEELAHEITLKIG